MAYGASTSDKKRSPAIATTLSKLLEFEQSQNIAELILDDEDGQEDLDEIAHEVKREYEIDKKSRAEWERTSERAMDVALQVRKPKNYPFDGAANIKYPLVTVAALQFGARAYPAIVDGNRIVKAQVLGNDNGIPLQQQMMGQTAMTPPQGMPPEMAGQMPPDQQQPEQQWQVPPGAKRAKADRVAAHMSYQLMCQMEEWEEDTDVLLHHLPIIGCAFRKIWRSEELGRNKAEMIPALHLVVNNKVRNLEEAPRITHEIYLYPQEIEERKRNGTFLDIELDAPTSDAEIDSDDSDAPHCFLEQHRFLDLDEDGYREPYIVTIHKDSCKVVRIVANFRVEDIKDDGKRITRIPRGHYFVKYSFIPDPKGGFYDIGFGALLESLGETIDTVINQMLDAGHLQNAGGGFIGSGVRLKKNNIKVKPGHYEQVSVSGNGDLRAMIYNHQFQGPSPVLFNLLGMMIEAARDITAVKDILTGDTGDKGVQTATTTLAMIEQGLKVFTAIYKRVYRAMADEFKLLFKLNATHLEDKEYFTFLDQEQAIAKEDYDLQSMDITPVADPKMVTDMQRSAKANVLLQVAASPLGPALNPQEALKRVFDATGMDEAEKLIAAPPPGPPPDIAAQIEDTMAAAKLKTAQAEKVAVETQILPKKAEHEGIIAENNIILAKDKAEAERERLNIDREKLGIDREKISVDAQISAMEKQHKMQLAEQEAAAKEELRQREAEEKLKLQQQQANQKMALDAAQGELDLRMKDEAARLELDHKKKKSEKELEMMDEERRRKDELTKAQKAKLEAEARIKADEYESAKAAKKAPRKPRQFRVIRGPDNRVAGAEEVI